MGLFLHVLIVPEADQETVKNALEKGARLHPEWELNSKECKAQECGGGVKVLLNDMCCGYEDIPKEISKELMCPALLCYIYDGDYWGYYFYENGIELDAFQPMPDYFEEVSVQERKRLAGNSEIISKYFHVDIGRIENYLHEWTDDIPDAEESRAYGDDESCIGEDWQMADFMKAIGYPYDWEG